MPYADDHPGYTIETTDQAVQMALGAVMEVERARAACNVTVPDNQEMTVRMQRKAYEVFMLRQGSALGILTTLHRCRKLDDLAYNDLRQRTLNTLASTIVGNAA